MEFIAYIAVTVAAVLYISKRWNEAKQKRDVYETLKPYAGIIRDEKKPSAFPFLFK
jgi:hypothetical protein